MKLTFGEDLESFARSIDICRFEEFEDVLDSTREYLEANFNITKVERLAERVYHAAPNLEPTLNTEDQYEHYPVRDDHEEANGLNACAFIRKRKQWVVPEDKEATLDEAIAYRELWNPNEKEDLPRYVRLLSSDGQLRSPLQTKTLISIPMVKRGTTTSLVYFESEDTLVASERARDELEGIAKAIARLHELADQNDDTHLATAKEIKFLGKSSQGVQDWGVSVPSLFFAYPDDADEEVMAEFSKQLTVMESGNVIRLFDWRTNYEGGRIPDKIEKEIGGATYFVAYLSEQQGEAAKHAFFDNPNVMYEAGMFQGLVNDVTQRATSWLLVREPDSLAPFDISTVNMLLVPRKKSGSLKKSEFTESLSKRIANLIPGLPDEIPQETESIPE